MAESKDELRARFRKLRASIPPDERARIDDAIARRIIDLPAYREAQALFAYLSFGNEVETRAIMRDAWDRGKLVALPYCIPGTRTMTWHRVESLDGLVRSKIGVEEPAPDPATEVDPLTVGPAIALVPGLTFDDRGFRLGYGGGFYDVFLSRFPGTTVGLCRSAQAVASLDVLGALDEHDLPVHIVVMET